jgi:predicted regulator of Ras-like GTPase activity (Roadblock/LC7/MglB family)
VTQKTDPSADLAWLLDDLIKRVPEAQHAIVLSADGLLMAASREFEHEDAEHLAAVAAGIQSLAKGVGERFDGGPVRQTVVEMRSAYLLVTVAGQGACLAVLSTEEADIGLIAYEMAMLVTGLGHHLTAASRNSEQAS